MRLKQRVKDGIFPAITLNCKVCTDTSAGLSQYRYLAAAMCLIGAWNSWPNGGSCHSSRRTKLPVTRCHPSPPTSGLLNSFELLRHWEMKHQIKWKVAGRGGSWQLTTKISTQAMKTNLGHWMQINSFIHISKGVGHVHTHNQSHRRLH